MLYTTLKCVANRGEKKNTSQSREGSRRFCQFWCRWMQVLLTISDSKAWTFLNDICQEKSKQTQIFFEYENYGLMYAEMNGGS